MLIWCQLEFELKTNLLKIKVQGASDCPKTVRNQSKYMQIYSLLKKYFIEYHFKIKHIDWLKGVIQ